MDTSETYIKMSDCPEIQENWKPTGGDWYIFDYRGTTKAGRDFEKRVWGDDDETWKRIEILCYQPSELKDWWVSTAGEESLVKSSQDMMKERTIWLPRQDQLQEMVEGQLWDRFDKFSVWSHNKSGFPGAWSDWTLRFTSMEQLWLAFVMKQDNKTWDGEKWEDE